MVKNKLINALHFLIVIFIFTFWLWPVKVLRKWFWIPCVLFFIWFIWEDCPITVLTHGESQSFMHDEIFTKFVPSITREQSSHLNTFLIVTSIILAAFKVIKCCEAGYPKSCVDKWGWV